MKTVIILKGCAGAGKTTWIQRFIKTYQKIFSAVHGEYAQFFVCSADKYFQRPDGTYSWNALELGKAHQWCYLQFVKALHYKCPYIFIDNTNTKYSDYEKYIETARSFDYDVKIKEIGNLDEESLQLYASRNSHQVPYTTIKKQAERLRTK
jgi:NEDD4-binding protein 2